MKAPIHLITAPSNLGLRPLRDGHAPGTWRAPGALLKAGLRDKLPISAETRMDRPRYTPDPVDGTRLRNGVEMRRFNLELAGHVDGAWRKGQFSLVLGGDCSILLGCLAGIRQSTPVSLLHIDGHSDFRHPGNYDAAAMLGAVAGMDLALATGRGEPFMTEWPGVGAPLVSDMNVVQLGERETRDADWAWPDVLDTDITVIDVFEARDLGVDRTAVRIRDVLRREPDWPVWIHFDVDVLDQSLMPAVDSPGSPGLDPDFLIEILNQATSEFHCAGMTVTVFDPDLDPNGRYASRLVDLLTSVFDQAPTF